MIIEIDDDYKNVIVAAILKEHREFTKAILKDGDYWNEDDRHYDERLLAALNVVIADYCVEGLENVNGSE